MPEAFFKWIDCTDKTRPQTLERRPDTTYRIAHITDIHLPGEVELVSRLRDLVSTEGSLGDLTHELSAISNEFGHHYRSTRRLYNNLIKKALVGLHRLGVDHLVITGDLVHCGVAAEFLDIRAALQVTGWWGDDKLTVIPGNHDRFNLYEKVKRERMESFFPVVTPREPRFKVLPSGVALLEIDSNRDPVDDRHHLEEWLPNTVGRIYPEVLDYIENNRQSVEGMRLVTLVHHHITSDWYPRRASTLGGLMEPADGVDELMEAIELIDPYSIILHGHKHDIMDIDYTHGTHQVGCPGGFAESLRLNLIDFNRHGEETMTQIELKV